MMTEGSCSPHTTLPFLLSRSDSKIEKIPVLRASSSVSRLACFSAAWSTLSSSKLLLLLSSPMADEEEKKPKLSLKIKIKSSVSSCALLAFSVLPLGRSPGQSRRAKPFRVRG